MDNKALEAASDEELQAIVNQLQANLWAAQEEIDAREYQAHQVCAKCGSTNQPLTTVRAHVAEDDDGSANVVMVLCNMHLEQCVSLLRGFGFRNHYHGVVNFLEDEDCPGAHVPDDCPTPSMYGTYFVPGPKGIQIEGA